MKNVPGWVSWGSLGFSAVTLIFSVAIYATSGIAHYASFRQEFSDFKSQSNQQFQDLKNQIGSLTDLKERYARLEQQVRDNEILTINFLKKNAQSFTGEVLSTTSNPQGFQVTLGNNLAHEKVFVPQTAIVRDPQGNVLSTSNITVGAKAEIFYQKSAKEQKALLINILQKQK